MRSRPALREILLCLAAAGVAACGDRMVRVEPAARVVSAEIIPVDQPLARLLHVELDRPAPVEVTYGSEVGSTLRVVSDGVEAVHRIVLARLRAGRVHDFEVRAVPGEGSLTGSFRTDTLPDLLDALSFRTEGVPTLPLIALDVQHTVGFGGLVVLDGAGEVVWYHEAPGGVVGSTQRANGNFAFIERRFGVREHTPAGELVAALPNTDTRTAHHDVIEHDGRLLFLTYDPRPWNDSIVTGDAVWSWSTGTGAVEPVWSSWDYLDPAVDWGEVSRMSDWLHANSISIGPRGNLVISLHFLDQVVSVDLARSAFEWRFGGVNATISVAEAERFRGQHTAAEISPNRVLMFDNGWHRTEERFSRAVIFEIDPAGGTSRKIREFRAEPDNWARALSLAREIPGGNLFVHFGGNSGPVESYEVRPGGEVVWKMVTEGVPSIYRAWPLTSIAGEEEG